MKKIVIALSLLALSGSIQAGDSLGLIFKVGTTLVEENASSAMVTLQVDDCQHCITGSFIHLDSPGFDGQNKNEGIGIDYLYKIPHQAKGWYYITGGAYVFDEPINDAANDSFSYHAGAGMDLNGFVLAVDVFGQPFGQDVEWSPVTLFSAGWHF